MSEYIFTQGKKRRTGFTTGICAAAAARAATIMLLSGRELTEIELAWRANGAGERPGHPHRAVFTVEDTQWRDGAVRCGVRKDAGDDVDVTDGLLICAEVRLKEAEGLSRMTCGQGAEGRIPETDCESEAQESALAEDNPEIVIRGGEGIGTVTLSGLNQPPGEAAINSGPRRMIREAVRGAWQEFMESEEVLAETGLAEPGTDVSNRKTGAKARSGDKARVILTVTVSAPGGEKLAARTFNPVLGIQGGISILGTTGIVEPMSGAAVEETVRAEVRVRMEKTDGLVLVPGNTGAACAKEVLGIAPEHIVQCSNYAGAALDEACGLGVRKILLVGALGKFIKLAGGIFNTHSHESDARMDILMRCALRAGAGTEALRRLDTCVTTDAALDILSETGLREKTLEIVCRRALYYLRRRCGGPEEAPETALVLLAGDGRMLAASPEAKAMAESFRKNGFHEPPVRTGE